MTCSVAVVHAGSSRTVYYTKAFEKVGEYYLGNRETGGESQKLGFWLGHGAKQMGLTHRPIVQDDLHFAALLKGLHPFTGTLLRKGCTTERTYADAKTGEKKSTDQLLRLISLSLEKKTTTYSQRLDHQR